MTATKLLDSSVWVEYLFNNRFHEIIHFPQLLLLSSLSLFEIGLKLRKERLSSAKITAAMNFVIERSLIIPVTPDIAHRAVDVAYQHKLPAADSLIYATALSQNAEVVTCDNDFRGLPEVVVLPL